MGTVLLVAGAASFAGYLIWLIICTVNWDSKIPPVIGMLLSLVMIAGGLSMTPRFMTAMNGFLSKTPLNEILAKVDAVLPSGAQPSKDGAAEGIWYADFYPDGSQESAGKWYITASSPLSGTFNDDTVSNQELTAELQADQEGGFTFLLYKYGNEKVANTFPDRDLTYDITMRTPDGAEHKLTGAMAASDNRLSISAEDRPAVLAALQGGGTLHFYIETVESPIRNFLLSVPTDNFAGVYQAQTGG